MTRPSVRRRANTVFAGLFAVALTALCACSTHGSDAAPMDPGQSEAQLSPEVGSIEFPLDRYAVSAAEDEILASARSIGLSNCAQSNGVRFYASAPTNDIANIASTYFGVWVKKYAEKYGFVGAQSDADLVANGVKGAPHVALHGTLASRNNGKLTDKEWQTVDSCQGDASEFDSAVIAPSGPWSKPGSAAEDRALSGEAAKEIEADYNDCLRSKGLEPDPRGPGSAKGADDHTISSQQIRLALEVVDCKTRVGYVQRLSELVADAQAPIVTKYHKDLVAQRQRIDAALVKAKKVIADYSRDHPEFQ